MSDRVAVYQTCGLSWSTICNLKHTEKNSAFRACCWRRGVSDFCSCGISIGGVSRWLLMWSSLGLKRRLGQNARFQI
jgi:hypothetical protein